MLVAMSRGPSFDAPAVRMLIVDDDPFVLRSTERYARSMGFDVTALLHPEEALSTILGGARFDVLLTDVSMPGMDGPTLVREIVGRGIEIAVLYCSGTYGVESLPPGQMLLVKPFRRDELSRALTELGVAMPARP